MSLKRSASGAQKLTFQSKDPMVPVPPHPGPDSPATSGMLVELFSSGDPVGASIVIPGGEGLPGWTFKGGTAPQFKFVNRSSPGGLSSVKAVVLKRAKGIKVVGKGAGLALAGSQGAVGVRVTYGTIRVCARFAGANVKRDVSGQFLAVGSAPLADCSEASLRSP